VDRIDIDTGNEKISIEIPDNITWESVKPVIIRPAESEEAIISIALGNPLESKRLSSEVSDKAKIAVIVCDDTRYIPQKKILQLVLEELKNAGVKKNDISIVIASGTHPPMKKDAIINMLGKAVVDEYKIESNDAYDKARLCYLGKSSKYEIDTYINATVAKADYRIGIGTVDPHIFAGYSGGNKLVGIGTAGEKTIEATHNPMVMENRNTKFADIENNLFRDMIDDTAKMIGIDFLINTVINSKKELIGMFCGNTDAVYREAVSMASGLYQAEVEKAADIVITIPKYPKTNNLYQAVRAINSVVFLDEPILKRGGTCILPAACPDGIGSKDFYSELASSKNAEEYINQAKEQGFSAEGNKAFTVAKMLYHCEIIVTDTRIEPGKLNNMGLGWAETAKEALFKAVKKGDHLVILEDGFTTLPKIREAI